MLQLKIDRSFHYRLNNKLAEHRRKGFKKFKNYEYIFENGDNQSH